MLERDEELNEWMLTGCDTPITDSLKKEAALVKLVDYMRSAESFDGSASRLLEVLGLDMQPNILSRKLSRYRQELLRAGMTFSTSRTGKQRILSLRYRDYDGMTVARCGGSEPSQIPEPIANTGFSE